MVTDTGDRYRQQIQETVKVTDIYIDDIYR